MKKFTLLIIVISITYISSCASNSVLTPEGKEYYSENNVKYGLIQIDVSSKNETKAIESGYMSNEELQSYLESHILQYLKDHEIFDQNGVTIQLNMAVNRIYAWGGSSMATFDYRTDVQLMDDAHLLGTYKSSGKLSDNSISGNLKAIFAANGSKVEYKYIDAAINEIMSELPD